MNEAVGKRIVVAHKAPEHTLRCLRATGAVIIESAADELDERVATDEAVSEALLQWGRLDGVVVGPGEAASVADDADAIAADATSFLAIVRAAAPAMRAGGSIVFVSSAMAASGAVRVDVIQGARAAARSMASAAASAYAWRGIRVNAVAPGLATPRARTASAAPPTFLDVTGAVLWLLSDSAAHVTGQVVGVGAYRPAPPSPRPDWPEAYAP